MLFSRRAYATRNPNMCTHLDVKSLIRKSRLASVARAAPPEATKILKRLRFSMIFFAFFEASKIHMWHKDKLKLTYHAPINASMCAPPGVVDLTRDTGTAHCHWTQVDTSNHVNTGSFLSIGLGVQGTKLARDSGSQMV